MSLEALESAIEGLEGSLEEARGDGIAGVIDDWMMDLAHEIMSQIKSKYRGARANYVTTDKTPEFTTVSAVIPVNGTPVKVRIAFTLKGNRLITPHVVYEIVQISKGAPVSRPFKGSTSGYDSLKRVAGDIVAELGGLLGQFAKGR